MKISFLIFALLIFSSPDFLVAAEELRLEGVVEDSKPSESLAVINGEFYKAGDSIGEYRVKEVKSKSVSLVHLQSAQTQVLEISARKVEAVPDQVVAKTPATFLEKMQATIKTPAQAVNRVWEVMALRELALINNAAVLYYEKNEFFPVKIRQLTLDGFLPPAYENGQRDKYQFVFTNTPMKPDALELHANPLDPTSKLLYFFVGADAVIRESSGKPADIKSPPHDYPGLKTSS